MNSQFEQVTTPSIVRFVAENPFAWILPAARPGDALLMPLLMECDAQGIPVSLLGHLPRRSGAAEAFSAAPGGVFLFLGPHAYISPAIVSKPGWAPTWNFVSLKASGHVELDEALTSEAVTRLVEHMERGTGSDWTISKMGARFETLQRAIIGFRVRIENLSPRFKYGQDETAESFKEIHAALGDHPLKSWMGDL